MSERTAARSQSAATPDGILDTSVVIELERQDPDSLPVFPAITAITLAELSAGPLVAHDDAERAARQARLQLVEASFDPLPFDADAAREFGQVAASLRANGRRPAARAYDALIAATAIAAGLPLYTLNPADFVGIDRLDLRVLRRPNGSPDDSASADEPPDPADYAPDPADA